MKERTVICGKKEFKYILLNHVKVLTKYGDGNSLELNLIIWDNDDSGWNTQGDFVYDIRLWDNDHTHCNTGLKLHKYRLDELTKAFNSVRDFEIRDGW